MNNATTNHNSFLPHLKKYMKLPSDTEYAASRLTASSSDINSPV